MTSASIDREPHLTTMKRDGAERITALEWARFLSNTYGTSGALDALRLYTELGWISESVRRTMTDYVRGLSGEGQSGTAEPTDAELSEELGSLSETAFHGHAKSLEYIAIIENESLSYALASTPTVDGPTLPETASDADGDVDLADDPDAAEPSAE